MWTRNHYISFGRFLVVVTKIYASFPVGNGYFRLSVLKFSGNSIKQKQSIGNLHGSTHWVLVTSLANLNQELQS